MNTAKLAIALLLLTAAPIALSQQENPCAVDSDAMLALDQQAFDQDMDGGWRVMARNPECRGAAADLIRAYINLNGEDGEIMTWHEGQMRAMDGQTPHAIELLQQTYKPPEYNDWFGWNHYVDATLAFLQRDRTGLEQARKKLSALPRPHDYNPVDTFGKPIDIQWPPNLNVVDDLLRCFNHSYVDAYNQCSSTFVNDGKTE